MSHVAVTFNDLLTSCWIILILAENSTAILSAYGGLIFRISRRQDESDGNK
jgi:hypothetical protein